MMGMRRSYYFIPKAISYVLKGDYKPYKGHTVLTGFRAPGLGEQIVENTRAIYNLMVSSRGYIALHGTLRRTEIQRSSAVQDFIHRPHQSGTE